MKRYVFKFIALAALFDLCHSYREYVHRCLITKADICFRNPKVLGKLFWGKIEQFSQSYTDSQPIRHP